MAQAAQPNSPITTLLRRIRFYLDEPASDKYTENDLLDLVIPSAVQEVWAYVNAAADNPVVASFPMALVPQQASYLLPPSVQNVWRVGLLDPQGNLVGEIVPRTKWHALGAAWFIEGNMITFEPIPTAAQSLTVYFSPVYDQPWHRGVGTLDTDLSTFTLAAAPQLGYADKRDQGYVGAALRIFGATVVETRVIGGHNPDTAGANVVTIRPAFTRNPLGAYTYEVFPLGSAAFIESIALAGALKLAAARSLPERRVRFLWDQFRTSRKTEAQRLANMMGRRGKYLEKQTSDNPDLGMESLATMWGVAG